MAEVAVAEGTVQGGRSATWVAVRRPLYVDGGDVSAVRDDEQVLFCIVEDGEHDEHDADAVSSRSG